MHDLLVRPKYRNKGYATCALHAAEAWASALGMLPIDLGHDTGAHRLYEKARYQATRIRMTKALS
ncbi:MULTISPECIES: GNAT family N-acetyltransferase [unclassified Paraburkholderia]|uniref:GNAT family N-acetyltransferase n=1 Tax=unclassified Paraburkholderia TaxID=2615204 RepID=UPI000D08585D